MTLQQRTTLNDFFRLMDRDRLRAAGFTVAPGIIDGGDVWKSPNGKLMSEEQATDLLARMERDEEE